MSDCLFCNIARREIPAYVVYEDDAALAFLDIHPHAPGHTMVIPKTHAATIFDLPQEELGPLFTAVKKVAEILIERLHAQGLTIGVNHGSASGQVVEHLHVHLMPRFTGDGGGSIHSVVKNPPTESPEKLAKKIRGE